MVELSPVMSLLTFAALIILGAVYAVACCHYVADDEFDTIDEHAAAMRALSAGAGRPVSPQPPRPQLYDWSEED
jgi:hypothetical protein